MARHARGTNPKLTQELIDQLAEAIRAGCYVETAAALCGISKDSLYRWLRAAEREESESLLTQLSDAVKKALAESELRDLAVIDAAAQRGEWTAAAWRLERKFPSKWGRQARVQVEHSGPEGGPIEVSDVCSTLKRVLIDPSALAALETLEATIGLKSESES